MPEPYTDPSQYDSYVGNKEKNWYEWQVNWPDIVSLLPAPPKTLLDFGIGTGEFTKELIDNGYLVDGCDQNEHMLEIAKNVNGVVNTFNWDGTTINSKSYEIVLAKLCLHYVKDLNNVAKNLSNAIARGGVLVVSVPHPLRSADNAQKQVEIAYSYTAEIGESGEFSTMWHRPIDGWVNPFIDNGLKLIEISEPVPTTEQMQRKNYTYQLPKRLNLKFMRKH